MDLDNFCPDELWLPERTWNSATPGLTKCLANMGLTMAPSILFFILLLLELKFTFSSPNKRIHLNGYNVVRLVICFVGNYSAIALLVNYLINYEAHTASDLVAAVCKVLVFTLLTATYHFHRVNGVITSGILFFSTALFTVCSFLVFLDSAIYNGSMYSEFESTNIFRVFLCNLCLFFLSWFTDDPVDAGLKPHEDDEIIPEKTDEHEAEKTKEPPACPHDYSSFISKVTFTYIIDLLRKAANRELKLEEIYQVRNDIKIGPNIKRFNAHFEEELRRIEMQNQRNPAKKKKFSISNTLHLIWRNQKFNIICLVIFKISADVIIFSQPLLLSFMLDFIRDENSVRWQGLLIVFGFILTSTLKTIFTNVQSLSAFAVAMNLRTAFQNLIFNKALRLSNQAKNKRTTGQITNLFTTDPARFTDFAPVYVYIISGPLQLALGFSILFYVVGKAAIVSVIIVFLIMICQYFLNLFMERYVTAETKVNDERIKLINEVLAGMKIIKLYGWEKPFIERITTQRTKQIVYVRRAFYLQMMLNWFFFSLAPFLMLSSTFAAYVLFVGAEAFTPEKAFVVILVFNLLNLAIECLPTTIAYLINVKVSLKRISDFLGENELQRYVSREYDEKLALSIENKARFTWEIKEQDEEVNESGEDLTIDTTDKQDKKPFELKDIELKVGRGEFIAVIGQIGSGKSSLISAILGEMHLTENDSGERGRVNVSSDQDISYVPQQAFIQNDTFKGNILFGKPLNQEKYDKVVDACCLRADLKQFEGGDLTEIGEKGINLSGGQKQRVSLARACYSSILIGDNQQIVLLDDVLSAVDAHVGKSLCENVLSSSTGILKDTTRILVTNQLNQLGDLDVDQIVLLKDGKIALKCTYIELLEMEKNDELDDFNLRLVQNQKKDETDEEDEKSEKSDKSEASSSQNSTDKKENGKEVNDSKTNKTKLIEKEKREKGQVKLKNHLIYLQNFGKRFAVPVLLFIVIENIFGVVSRLYLANWTEAKLNSSEMSDKDFSDFHRYHLLIFIVLSSLDSLFDIAFNLCMAFGVMRTIKLFHEKLLYKIMRSPQRFFDQTPLGRILNRFSKDIRAIDEDLAHSVRELTVFILRLLSSMVIIIYMQPNSLIFYVFIFAIYWFIMHMFISASRQIRRWESTTRSPIYSHLGETLNGLSTLRAYDKLDEVTETMQSTMNVNNRCFWTYLTGNRWLNVYLDFLTCAIVFLVTFQFILQKDTTAAGDAGLLLTYALTLTQNLSNVIRHLGTWEANAVSIERINEYLENEEEDEWVKDVRPDTDWPKNGEIEFIDYSTRYREGTGLVLKDLNFKVDGAEKVGVVGRTGAGKTSMTLALFRIIEPASGRIVIDGVDISKIGLHDLKSRLSIIPQDATLFTGTIRFNLDPFNKHPDEEIYRSLEHAHLIDYVNSLEDGIEHQVAEGGENLSVGQRQLVCLARALLRKSKILVLDEATASVDFATDELVQSTIRSEFKACTTITIAHRLKTVLDSSRILVLDKGQMEEYDTPERLLQNPSSSFYSLALKANLI